MVAKKAAANGAKAKEKTTLGKRSRPEKATPRNPAKNPPLSVAVFCGARPGNAKYYTDAASELGRQLAERNMTLLYGGATVGCMGEMGRAVREAPGVARGFIPKKLAELNGSVDAVITDNMAHNKAMLFGHCDATLHPAPLSACPRYGCSAIAMSGGIGTLEELSEFLSMRYLADSVGATTAGGTYRRKPLALLNTRNFFKLYMQQLRHMVKEGFVLKEHVDQIIVESDVTTLLDRLTAAVAADSNVAASKQKDPNYVYTCTH